MILLITNPVNAIDTGDLKAGFNEINLPLDVSIKLWGYEDIDDDLIPFFENSLPQKIIGESAYPSENKIDQQVMFIRDGFWGIQNLISYNFDSVDLTSTSDLMSKLSYYPNSDTNNVTTMTASYHDGSELVSQSGFTIEMQHFTNLLEPYNNENGYTLHLLNFTEINNHPNNTNNNHWYRLGELRSLENQDDIRNVGIVGDTGLFYDPSASAPHFDQSYFENSNHDNLLNILSTRVTDLIETVFVGSPIYYNYNFLNPTVTFDQVLIGSLNDNFTKIALDDLGPGGEDALDLTFNEALTTLFPYLEISTEVIRIVNESEDGIKEIMKLEKAVPDSSETYIKITTNVAEKFKNIIINNYKENPRPTGYYFLSVIFVESENRKFIWDTEAGEREYEYGEISFGILNLAKWSKSNQTVDNFLSIKQLGIQNFGKTLGLPIYSNEFVSQINSPMSNYGVADDIHSLFNQFEIASIARRFGAHYNNSAIHNLRAMRADLKDGGFRWLDRSGLDKAELSLRLGDLEYAGGNFTGAVALYIKGYFEWLDARDDLTQWQGAFYNGIQLIAIIFVLLYLISTLKLFSIKKKEFYSNME